MKKNKMMRLASAMMVMTLMTTSVISGTFAKYVSETSASDNARVAKWGVTLVANGLLYSELYDNVANGNEGTTDDSNVSVATYNYDGIVQSVVAPGTVNPGDGFTFTVDGRPEVAVALTGTIEAATTVLPAATYVVLNSSSHAEGGKAVSTTTATHTLANVYYPVEYTLTKDGASLVTDGTIIAVCEAIDELLDTGAANTKVAPNKTVEYFFEDTHTTDQDYAPNTDLGAQIDNTGTAGEYKLTWKWDFENTDMDVYDTFLGDLAYAAVGKNASEISPSKVVCYTDGTNTFYSLDAYQTLEDSVKTTLTEVKASELVNYGIGITEKFALAITATQID